MRIQGTCPLRFPTSFGCPGYFCNRQSSRPIARLCFVLRLHQTKNSLRKEFSAFLGSLSGNKTLFSAIPKDVCRFLAWKDSRGKTQVHVTACSYLGKHQLHSCGCPVSLCYATVDSYIGKFRAIFKEAGREGDWNSALGLGNPAASADVKAYLKAFTSEQLQAAVTPKQATPLFLVKIVQLSRLIQEKC